MAVNTPKKLNWKRVQPLILKANFSLAKYDEALKKAPKTKLIKLKNDEAAASIRTTGGYHQKLRDEKKALDFALALAETKPLNIPFLCQIEGMVKNKIGQLRTQQNWIGPEGGTIEDAYFFPPAPNLVKGCMQKLIRYGQKKEKEPLVQLAVYFAQFLIIHPFMDGNGRVIRIFIPLFLWKKKITSKPYFFMSHYFEKHRLKYFQKLFDISEKGDWESWIEFFLKGVIVESKRLKKMLSAAS